MATPSTHIESPDRNLTPSAPRTTSPDRPDATRPGGRVGGVGRVRVLRRWSVADLIARAGGVPRAFA
ncbi:MAG TPA: hypothetical protein VGH67_08635 [Solirubrobacteraceae bacterium]|jgi:hypothetical protein